jgi:tRNA nucleotidyltransferase (CCA-adding enzyme)
MPRALRPTVAAARDLAGQRGVAVYLAGGIVRDLFFGQRVRDLDLVVAGDGIDFARRLAVQLGASIREHHRFGTAALELPGGESVDVASTRRETYSHPGALPSVVAGVSIEEDLARRDFTVNAMALELAPGGRLVDLFGAARDMTRGAIRELHPRSFFDDPTRIFRAVRYANRLGFRIPRATRRAIADALAGGALERVSGDRVRRELRRILDEPERGRAIALMQAVGVLEAVDPALATDARTTNRVRRAEGLARPFEGRTTWLCYLLAWMGHAGEREVERVADRLALAGAESRILRRWPEVAGQLSRAAATPSGPAVRRGLSADEIVAAASGVEARLRPALLEIEGAARRLRLEIRGADLLAAGIPAGPALGAALAQTLAARQAGRIQAQDELAFALEAVKAGSR